MLSRFAYSFLYVFVLYMAANSAFHMIDWLPEHAGKWMGMTPMHYSKMGDPDNISQPMLLITGYADQQMMQGVGQLAGNLGAGKFKEMLGRDLKNNRETGVHAPGGLPGAAPPLASSSSTTAAPGAAPPPASYPPAHLAETPIPRAR